MDGEQSTQRFEQALVYAAHVHRNQRRKVSAEPYVAHLLAVTALVIEDGGDIDESIAALLHDAVEDQGGLERLEEIRRLFGDRVAEIVDGCSDAYTMPKPPWRERKERYILHLRTASPSVLRVSLADKLHNARSILRDLHKMGPKTWDRFKGGKEGTLWYYHSLVEVFQTNKQSPMVYELTQVVGAITALADETAPQ